jgi:hypothetical protein
MEMAAYHIVTISLRRNSVTHSRTRVPNWTIPRFEKLPYLTGVVKEGQRLSYGVISDLPRATPEGGATFNGILRSCRCMPPSPN